jgi:predicted ATPase
MIKRFRVQNYKALRDVTLDLTPLHLLIGPNDSGKTSILEAIAALCRSVDHDLKDTFLGSWDGRELVSHGNAKPIISFDVLVEMQKNCLSYHLSCRFNDRGRNVLCVEERIASPPEQFLVETSLEQPLVESPGGRSITRVYRFTVKGDTKPLTETEGQLITFVKDAITGIHYYRWVPQILAIPTAPDSKRRFRMESTGFGLALCLDDILGYDRDRFIALENRFREIFPQVKSIKLIAEPAFRAPVDDPSQRLILQQADGKGIYFEFVDSRDLVPASQASDGLLLVLAYLTILNLPHPPRVILIEEPENGIHPKRLREVLTILRSLVGEQSITQIIMTTHSPYVVDLFEPDEVTLCQRQNNGSVSVRRLSESPIVRDQIDVFTLGEIWTAEGEETISAGSV